jgi:hypothetical protein
MTRRGPGLAPESLGTSLTGARCCLLAAGYDMKVVRASLRLSSISIAADLYTSLLPRLARQSAEDAAAIVLNAQPHPPTPVSARVAELV